MIESMLVSDFRKDDFKENNLIIIIIIFVKAFNYKLF